ncbi:hypothetical protein A6V39_04435 [Candidatus Mycoplasma haematobovis]|uniref:Uncharacterized protein n=1 Tax=Candidatus Mycoplasma haematobovis TaxID=432608 RepID=A0A1A9QC32_9MOLU|nr:hypothetical protein [Candidatus Mycoplasma haematobovis]OAL10132.1 hypothetical protein A6V39_04435 [Candidatus Mycoplasma haematobovis]
MRTTTLIGLGLGGTTALAGTGVAINHFYGGESIRAYIDRTKTSKNKVFLVAGRSDLNEIKIKYHESKDSNRVKPKDDKGSSVDKEKLVQWCADNANTKFSSVEDETYKAILSWCFLNSKTISEEMASESRQIYSNQGAAEEEWKIAWNNYNTKKNILKLSITGDDLTDLNGTNDVAGGKALHKWCDEKNKDKKKLYEDGVEATYALFRQWCTK